MNLENNLNGQNGNIYERLGERIKKVALKMTPEQMDAKWGKGSYVYVQSFDNYMAYLRKERRKVEERKEKVPQEFYDQTHALDLPKLKNWYNANEGLKHKDRQLKKIVYTERMLELIAQRFNVEIKAAQKGSRNPDGQIRTSKDLKSMCDTDPKARYLVNLCQGNDVDVADIIAVVYDGRITRDDAIKILQEPSLREYLGEFRKTIGIQDIRNWAEELLPLDKNKVIESIVRRRIIEYLRNKLGPKPTYEQRADLLKEMQKTLDEIV